MKIFYNPCEPFRAYNRLEGRPRTEELDDSLAARIHDPLWMLTRQYQFGELKGEDAGTAVFAKAAISTVKINSFTTVNGAIEDYAEDIPLETKVERLIPQINLKIAARLGRKFLEILDQEGASAQASLNYSKGKYKVELLKKFPFEVPQMQQNDTSTGAAARAAKTARDLSLQQATAFLRAVSGRALNGKLLWEFLGRDATRIKTLVMSAGGSPSNEKFILASHQNILVTASSKWIDFVVNELNLPESDAADSWVDERLEYTFEVGVKEANGGETTLHANEYFNGHLDWYSFDVKKENNVNSNTFDENLGKREVLTVIPSEASFAGMPNARWWELEDGSVDLANLSASDTDIVKILVSQYATKYSNDWLSIPYELPTGSLAKLEGILVKDTFGQNTLVEAAHQSNNDWNEWNMYSLSVEKGEFETPDFDKRILLPPAAVKTLESDSLEEIRFIRDEMANMVWAIETRIPDGLGNGMDGYEAASNLQAEFDRLIEQKQVEETIALPEIDLSQPTGKASTYKPQLKYQLGNSVSENWIPFIPVHQAGSNREIQLQRASMPRINGIFEPHAIRPRTPLLRQGVAEDDSQPTPMYLNEEEVPRAGVKLTGTFQRTRWYNGKIVTWYGRRKTTGRGEGSSGLRFDLVLENSES